MEVQQAFRMGCFARIMRTTDGEYKVFATKSYHEGIVVRTPEQAEAAAKWLKKQQLKGRVLSEIPA